MIGVSYTYQKLSLIFLGVTTVALLPFIIADLSFLYTNDSPCVLQGFPSGELTNAFQILFVGKWLQTDGYIKMAVLFISLYFYMLKMQVGYDKLIFGCFGNILRSFWVFNLAWNITGGVMFWGNVDYNQYCQASLTNYMFAVLISNYILSPICFVLSLLRPANDMNETITVNQNSNIYTKQTP